jgi:Ran GTPase-activating protein (RanGAP) involved in mRNA processing and transport
MPIHCAHLSLSNNQLTDTSITKLATALQSTGLCHPIRSLILSYNCITEEGASALALMLQEGSSLEHLDLEGNHINLEGTQAIAQVVPSTRLSSILLSYNSSESPKLSCWTQAMQSPSLVNVELAQVTTHVASVCCPSQS